MQLLAAYARREQMDRYAAEGYQGCIGRTLDRISVFPDGRAYVCSYLFDTSLNFAQMTDGQAVLNHEANEFDLFTGALARSSCGGCKSAACLGGCPAEQVVTGTSSCEAYPGIVPVCRLWKSNAWGGADLTWRGEVRVDACGPGREASPLRRPAAGGSGQPAVPAVRGAVPGMPAPPGPAIRADGGAAPEAAAGQ